MPGTGAGRYDRDETGLGFLCASGVTGEARLGRAIVGSPRHRRVSRRKGSPLLRGGSPESGPTAAGSARPANGARSGSLNGGHKSSERTLPTRSAGRRCRWAHGLRLCLPATTPGRRVPPGLNPGSVVPRELPTECLGRWQHVLPDLRSLRLEQRDSLCLLPSGADAPRSPTVRGATRRRPQPTSSSVGG